MTRFWMAVASYEHVKKGVEGGFAQVCHGKKGPLNRMHQYDGIIYYSPVYQFRGKEPCQRFTAIGSVQSDSPYPFQMSENFIPWRINVDFLSCNDVSIRPLIDELEFIVDKKRWGFPFRRGCFEISERDFQTIATKMDLDEKAQQFSKHL